MTFKSGGVSDSNPLPVVTERQVVVYTTLTLGTTYAAGQNMGGAKAIACGIGNNTPFAISAIQVSFNSAGALNTAAPGGTINILGAAPSGTYNDAQAAVISAADQIATIRSGNTSFVGFAAGTYAAGVVSGYKALGSGATDVSGNIYLNMFSTTNFGFAAGVTVLIKLTLHYQIEMAPPSL